MSSYVPSAHQQRRLDEWLPNHVVVTDHAWGLVERAVWEIECDAERYIAKIGAPTDHHIVREINGHLRWLDVWTRHGRAPELVHHDATANLLVTRYLPGELVLGTPAADDPGTFEQAGRLLAQLHDQPGTVDPQYEARQNGKSLGWLDKPHRIPARAERRLREEIATWPTPPSTLVPTHGDWQPRNWLMHHGTLRVIDFGRAALEPAIADLARIDAQDFRRDPGLEEAFLRGYGGDPREPGPWRRTTVRNAISTAVWAHQVGDESFEQQGLRMVEDVLEASGLGD